MAWKLHSVAYLEGLLRVPVSLEFVTQCLLQFLAEYVDTSSRQFVVQIRDDKIQGHLYFNMHFDRCRFRSLTHYIHSHSHTRTHTNCLARLRSFRTLSLSLARSARSSIALLAITFCFLWVGFVVGGGWRGNYPGSDTRLRLFLYTRCTMFHCVFNFEYFYRNLWLIVSLLYIYICTHIYTACIYAYICIYT